MKKGADIQDDENSCWQVEEKENEHKLEKSATAVQNELIKPDMVNFTKYCDSTSGLTYKTLHAIEHGKNHI